MSILDLLKEKSVEEKENFLNSVRSRVQIKYLYKNMILSERKQVQVRTME